MAKITHRELELLEAGIDPVDHRVSLSAAIDRGESARDGLYHRQDGRGLREGAERKRDLKRTLRDYRN